MNNAMASAVKVATASRKAAGACFISSGGMASDDAAEKSFSRFTSLGRDLENLATSEAWIPGGCTAVLIDSIASLTILFVERRQDLWDLRNFSFVWVTRVSRGKRSAWGGLRARFWLFANFQISLAARMDFGSSLGWRVF